MTAPPYAFAFITTMITAYFSDRFARRAIFIIFWLIITIIGFIILIVVKDLHVKYFAVFLTAGCISPCVATCITFISCNISPHTKRATALAFMLSVGNSGGAISGQIYRSQDAPRFIFGSCNQSWFLCDGFNYCQSYYLLALWLENRRRDRLYGAVDVNNNKIDVTTTTTNKQIVDVLRISVVKKIDEKWGYESMSEQEIRDLGDKHAAWRYIL